jgi:hypothetical protein
LLVEVKRVSTATCAAEVEAVALMQALAAVDITRLPWPEAPTDQIMEVMRFLLDGSLTERPKQERATREDRKNLAWCFLAGQDFRPMAVRTFWSLEQKVLSGALYFTPNTFYGRRSKTANGLRWINAIYVDLDDPELSLLDVLEAVAEAGLPGPTLMVKTPNGMHAYWKLKPVRATERAVRCYTALLRAVAVALGADLQAATPERFLRVPRQLLYFTRTEYKLQDFVDWHKSWESEEEPQNTGDGRGRKAAVVAKDILLQPAIVELWKGVEKGRRNCTCFTLALALKAARCSYEDAIVLLRNWNQRNLPPLSETEVVRTVHSAYSGRYHGPRAEMVRYLSGQEFRYRTFPRGSALTVHAEDHASRRRCGRSFCSCWRPPEVLLQPAKVGQSWRKE